MADESSKKFTFDPEAEGAEIPTLTSLLYRKNLVKSDGSDKSAQPKLGGGAPTLEPTQVLQVQPETEALPNPLGDVGPGLSLVSDSPDLGGGSPAEIIPIDAASSPAGDSLPLALPIAPEGESPVFSQSSPPTAAETALTETNPAHRGIGVLKKRNLLKGAAVLSGNGQHFELTETIDRPEGMTLWNGISMEASEFSDLFNRLAKFGFAEFSPLAASGPLNLERIGFRTGFGIQPKEWLTLVRIGEASAPEAIVAVVSEGSIQAHLPFFHSASLNKAA